MRIIRSSIFLLTLFSHAISTAAPYPDRSVFSRKDEKVFADVWGLTGKPVYAAVSNNPAQLHSRMLKTISKPGDAHWCKQAEANTRKYLSPFIKRSDYRRTSCNNGVLELAYVAHSHKSRAEQGRFDVAVGRQVAKAAIDMDSDHSIVYLRSKSDGNRGFAAYIFNGG